MFEWLDGKLTVGVEPPFVLAGVMHYGITDVHPFADGNGRAARLFQTALLMKTDVLPGRMFSFERYYAQDRSAYYDALRSVRRNTFNMEAWLEYFLGGLAAEYERVAATVIDLSSLVSAAGGQPLRLSAGQERGIATLRIAGRRKFTRRDYEEAAGLGRTAANDDLKELVQHGVIVPRGAGSARRYAFSAAAPTQAVGSRRGRPLGGTTRGSNRSSGASFLPAQPGRRVRSFANAGHGDLYAAASRSGGIPRWRRTFGL